MESDPMSGGQIAKEVPSLHEAFAACSRSELR